MKRRNGLKAVLQVLFSYIFIPFIIIILHTSSVFPNANSSKNTHLTKKQIYFLSPQSNISDYFIRLLLDSEPATNPVITNEIKLWIDLHTTSDIRAKLLELKSQNQDTFSEIFLGLFDK